MASLVLFAGHMLADKTHYLNHHYLVFLVAALLALMPWNQGAMPAWCVWALRAQVGLVYFFGGVAKLGADWLLHAQPLKIWLAANTDFPVIARSSTATGSLAFSGRGSSTSRGRVLLATLAPLATRRRRLQWSRAPIPARDVPC